MLFPAIALIATVGLFLREWKGLSYPATHQIFDLLIAISFVAVYVFYRVEPDVADKCMKCKKHKPHSSCLQIIAEEDGPWTNGDVQTPLSPANEILALGGNPNNWSLTCSAS